MRIQIGLKNLFGFANEIDHTMNGYVSFMKKWSQDIMSARHEC